jgi:hypothetical protein
MRTFTQVKATAPTAMTPEARAVAALCQKPSLAGLNARKSETDANQAEPMTTVRLTLFKVSMLIFPLTL